ncbi:MAG: hypothetical protein RTU92_05075 [Candidatus Thorarchaeota archaeon]
MSLIEEFKFTFDYWKSNKMAYISEMIRVILVFFLSYALITFTLVSIITLARSNLYPAYDFWVRIFPNFFGAFGTVFTLFGGTPLVSMGITDVTVSFVLFPAYTVILFFLFYLMLGGLYGMGKEIIETAGTFAQGATSWIRQKFGQFTFGSLFHIILGILPAMGMGLAFSTTFEYQIPSPLNIVALLLMIVVIFFAWGLLSLYMPALTDGQGLIGGLKKSIGLNLDNFVSVFKVWAIYFFLIIIWFIPMSLFANIEFTMQQRPEVLPFYTFAIGWNFIYGIFVLLILVPMMTIHLTRIYSKLTGKDVL